MVGPFSQESNMLYGCQSHSCIFHKLDEFRMNKGLFWQSRGFLKQIGSRKENAGINMPPDISLLS